MEVLIPNSFSATKTPFADLVTNQKDLLRVFRLFERELKNSFAEDERRMGRAFRERVQTQAELKRRSEIMARWFRVFRGDLGYSISQCEMEIGKALRSELDGTLFTPVAALRSYGVPEGEPR